MTEQYHYERSQVQFMRETGAEQYALRVETRGVDDKRVTHHLMLSRAQLDALVAAVWPEPCEPGAETREALRQALADWEAATPEQRARALGQSAKAADEAGE